MEPAEEKGENLNIVSSQNSELSHISEDAILQISGQVPCILVQVYSSSILPSFDNRHC